MVVEPLGKYLFLNVNYYDGYIDGFEIQSNGSLKKLSQGDGGLCSFPMGIVVEPTGKYVYAAAENQNQVGVFKIDRTVVPGKLNRIQLPSVGSAPCSVALAP
jgi:6-phosphogluconolactonase (cycloisomerase 2 family)